jgi:chitinase
VAKRAPRADLREFPGFERASRAGAARESFRIFAFAARSRGFAMSRYSKTRRFYFPSRFTAYGLLASAVVACSSSSDEASAGLQATELSAAECAGAPAWAENTAYATGALVRYAEHVYACVQAHTSLATWTPDAVPALWKEMQCAPGGSGGPITGGAGTGTGSSGGSNGATGGSSGGSNGGSSGSSGGSSGGSNGGSSGGSSGGSTGGSSGGASGLPSGKLFVGYYQTWSDSYKATGAETVLAHLPSYVNVVNLAFMQPDTTYAAGSLVLRGTTYLDVPYDGPTLKDAITALHQASPNTKVMVSVGGATLYNWGSFHPEAVAAFVSDFGLDGVDLDYEPATPNCTSAGGAVTCPSDAEYIRIVNAMRAALPRPKILSTAAWSVGAYGEGDWASAPPMGSAYTGIALAMLKDANASAALDLINVMSYDASPAYNPEQALKAYQHYFRGKIAMGIEVPPEAWGGHTETIGEIDSLADAVSSSGAAGLMLWSIQKPGPAQQFATEMCTKLGLADCAKPLM